MAQGPQGPAGQDGTNGTSGTNGLTPEIGENGNWWIGETDTIVPAKGQNGKTVWMVRMLPPFIMYPEPKVQKKDIG